MKRKHYEETFKREVVAAIEGGLAPVRAAEKFSVPQPNITLWRKKYGKPPEQAAEVEVAVPIDAAFWEIAEALGPLTPEQRESTLKAVQQALKFFSK